MLKLCGFAASNYYNVVKLALLEKGVPFEEQLAWLGETDPAASPLGKVPYAITEDGPISESTVILEYIEQRYAIAPLLPAQPYAAAKVRELQRFIDGENFSLADCAAAVHLPVLGSACRIIYGEDLLAALPVRDYLKRLGERPTVQKVNADRKTSTEQMMARYRAKA